MSKAKQSALQELFQELVPDMVASMDKRKKSKLESQAKKIAGNTKKKAIDTDKEWERMAPAKQKKKKSDESFTIPMRDMAPFWKLPTVEAKTTKNTKKSRKR